MEENNFEKLDQLVRSKKYAELDESERTLVAELLAGERAYERYRELMTGAASGQSRPVSRETTAVLMSKFRARNRSVAYSLLYMKIPAVANLAFLVIFLTGFWWFTATKEEVAEEPKVVYLPGRVDTVFSQLPADTVYVERIIRQQVPVYVASQKPAESPAPETTKGSTLADQEGLADFLVSSL